jgi:cell wall-associated NlpC family hydrolase
MPKLLLLADLGIDPLKVAATVIVAVLLALGFAMAAAAAMVTTAVGVRPAGPSAAVVAPPGEAASDVVAVARRYLGMPYVWGGASPGTSFDCSGLVQWSFAQTGVRLPRTAQAQFQATVRVPTADLRPGDALFFASTYPSNELITHVGIYVGNGRMINAPREGDVVREMDAFTGFWGAHYAGAGRPRGVN